jgi:hypothetical protein
MKIFLLWNGLKLTVPRGGWFLHSYSVFQDMLCVKCHWSETFFKSAMLKNTELFQESLVLLALLKNPSLTGPQAIYIKVWRCLNMSAYRWRAIYTLMHRLGRYKSNVRRKKCTSLVRMCVVHTSSTAARKTFIEVSFYKASV